MIDCLTTASDVHVLPVRGPNFSKSLGTKLSIRILWLLDGLGLQPSYLRSVVLLPKDLADKCFQRTPTSGKPSPPCHRHMIQILSAL